MARKRKKGHSRHMSSWDILVGIGSICGILAVFTVPHAIIQIRKMMPAIQYEVTGVVSPSNIENGVTVIEKNFNGRLKNLSHAPTSITSISLVVFNEKRNAYLRDGYSAEKIFEFSGPGEGHEITLPIQLNPKETKMLNIISFITLNGEDERLFPKSYPRLTDQGFEEAEYNYELIFEDVNGNNYDMWGNLVNKELMDLKWIHQDRKWFSPRPMFEVTRARVKFFVRAVASFFGFSTQ